MGFNIDIKPIALLDIDEAIDWYEKKLEGLGEIFLAKIDEAFIRISDNPQAHQIVHDPVRRILLKTFPYKVLYLIKDDRTIIIIAVIHLKRSRRYVKRRSKI